MSPSDPQSMLEPRPLDGSAPSERQSHTEHQAALDATLFRPAGGSQELVLELDAGELRLHPGEARFESR